MNRLTVRRASRLLLLLWCGTQACSRAHAEEPTWKAGVARAVVTPTTPVWLAGYAGQRELDGKLHDLWVKALALEAPDGGRAQAIREVSWERGFWFASPQPPVAWSSLACPPVAASRCFPTARAVTAGRSGWFGANTP